MQKSVLGAAILGGVIVLAIVWRPASSPASEVDVRSTGSAERIAGMPAPSSVASPQASEPTPSLSATSAASDHELLGPHEFAGEAERDLVLVAQTPEEAHWLSQRGYPRLSEWRARASLSTEELEARTAAGDLVASAMLAERVAAEGDFRRAEDLVTEAQVRGSVFASIVFAKITNDKFATKYQRTATGLEKNTWAAGLALAPLQYASLMGDYRASDVIRSLNMPRQGFASISSSMSMAHVMLEQHNRERAQRGLPPLIPAMRPGALAWHDARINNPPDSPIVAWRGWR